MVFGAIIGDILGSPYEGDKCIGRNITELSPANRFTDDTVMTIAVAKWLLMDKNHSHEGLVGWMQILGNRHLDVGYSATFYYWLLSDRMEPYESKGNGSAMRVSPIGLYGDSLEEVLNLARISAEVTHNTDSGIAGAQAIAASVFLARKGYSKDYIRGYITGKFGYNLDLNIDEIRQNYVHSWKCEGTVPQAITAFLDARDFVESISLAVSLGGDTDTLGAMAGSIAACVYEIPDEIESKCKQRLPNDLAEIQDEFFRVINEKEFKKQLSFYKVEDSFYAGEYPFAPNLDVGKVKISILEKLGVSNVIDLTEEDELIPYKNYLPSINYYRFPIKDRHIPDSFESVQSLMEIIREALENSKVIYIHCWGGVGRTGTIVACWLVYNGIPSSKAIKNLNQLWSQCPKSKYRPHCPEYKFQENFVANFENYLNNQKKK